MHKLSTSFILGYHGCDQDVAENILSGEPFQKSENDYDWLGSGVYFWESSPARALQFSKERMAWKKQTGKPAVVGAIIDLGLCLDTTTLEGCNKISQAHQAYNQILQANKEETPTNQSPFHKLDCAVINTLHEINKTPIDTVRGIFTEGGALYDNSAFYKKTHIQICVCNPNNIKGVFRVESKEFNI